MYVCTFYSFKGGVGRTMALVNTAVHLAERGRRVLLVDFDLEAPGLDTFSLLRTKSSTPGLVDYVLQYLKEDQAPDVAGFVDYSNEVENLLVMSSGAWGKDYAASFGRIDWGMLYSERDGYLLFEDLKEQWRQTIAPDYVLVDSRTGYTDTGGICTRQLPDAVTMLFFPNEQNLRGLSKIVADVRSEAEPPRAKTIKLHFVMSNVPDLDDEDDILVDMKERFRRDLEFETDPLVVHRYESLSLLNQAVFAKERPKSRLAREYSKVADHIVGGNLADRDGALGYIREARRRVSRRRYQGGDSALIDTGKIEEIERHHCEDGEILFQLGELQAHWGVREDAESLLDRAIESGYQEAEAYLERAAIRAKAGDGEGASVDAMAALQQGGVPPHLVMEAIRLVEGGESGMIAALPAVTGLDVSEQVMLASNLNRMGLLAYSDAILCRVVDDAEQPDESRAKARSALALNCIGSGRYRQAMETLAYGGRREGEMDIQDAFNYGMAAWANSGVVQTGPFDRVVSLDAAGEGRGEGANYLQCLSLANWAVGDRESALLTARRARDVGGSSRFEFSCWRYRYVRGPVFETDMDEILAMIEGDESCLPAFMGGMDGNGGLET
ncbi:MAG: AAA family ATPase [Gammaproteobacteria bacterium]|nr:AAA family ATPase [Gammaproteobacteria bacterium]MDE0177702.1 AAA family ATPase [Gammaproteobacteria bacterium]